MSRRASATTPRSRFGLLIVVSVHAGCARKSVDVVPPLDSNAAEDDAGGAVIVLDQVPPEVRRRFLAGDDASAVGPCLLSPEPGALLPRNWPSLELQWSAGGEDDTFEIRVRSDSTAPRIFSVPSPLDAGSSASGSAVAELLLYTRNTSLRLPLAAWRELAAQPGGSILELSLRSVSSGSDRPPARGTSARVEIVPADAPGEILYWVSKGDPQGPTALKSMDVSRGVTRTALTPASLAGVSCIGCHSYTPDHQAVGMTVVRSDGGALETAVVSLAAGTLGATPAYVSARGASLLRIPELSGLTFSAAHFTAGDRVTLATLGSRAEAQLAWIDLEAPAEAKVAPTGILRRDGDTRGGSHPAWSSDGTFVIYVSTDATEGGNLYVGEADLYRVPFGQGVGGAASPLPGGSSPSFAEYAPALSADDQWVLYTRVPTGTNMYDSALSEVFVTAAGSGPLASPIRLAANDPPSCAARKSPGVHNSGPMWGPAPVSLAGKELHWLAFASDRLVEKKPKLFLSAVVSDGGVLSTYPALYLDSQLPEDNGHTPAWSSSVLP